MNNNLENLRRAVVNALREVRKVNNLMVEKSHAMYEPSRRQGNTTRWSVAHLIVPRASGLGLVRRNVRPYEAKYYNNLISLINKRLHMTRSRSARRTPPRSARRTPSVSARRTARRVRSA